MAVIQQDHIGGDLAGAYDRLAAETVDAWKTDGRAEGTANMPWGEMPASLALQMLADDVLVHGWDLARSTGQQVDWDQALAAETLEFAQMMFASPEIRSGSFEDPLDHRRRGRRHVQARRLPRPHPVAPAGTTDIAGVRWNGRCDGDFMTSDGRRNEERASRHFRATLGGRQWWATVASGIEWMAPALASTPSVTPGCPRSPWNGTTGAPPGRPEAFAVVAHRSACALECRSWQRRPRTAWTPSSSSGSLAGLRRRMSRRRHW